MTVNEIVEVIYQERYTDPKDEQLSAYMRDVMIREVVQRTIELLGVTVNAAGHVSLSTIMEG